MSIKLLSKCTLPSKHHSISDWDWSLDSTFRSLSAAYYNSPPTSIKIGKANQTCVNTVLSRDASCQCLPQGQLISWVKKLTLGSAGFIFRNQAALDSANWLNAYHFYYLPTMWTLYRRIAGVTVNIGSVTPGMDIGEIAHCKLVWFNGENPAGNPALVVAFYKEIDDVWVQQSSSIYDTTNQFKDSPINRCGHFTALQPNQFVHFDDTEIWGP